MKHINWTKVWREFEQLTDNRFNWTKQRKIIELLVTTQLKSPYFQDPYSCITPFQESRTENTKFSF